ncbi:MAG: DUF3185 domain-containing protein [Bryobacteraceae bacterium]
MKIAGAILIIAGLVIIIWGAFGFKTRDTVADVGPIHATKETTHHVPFGPIVGGLVLIGGVLLIVADRRR